MTIKDISWKDVGFKIFLSFVILCPIFYDTNGPHLTRVSQEQFYQLGATVLFAIVFVENIYLSLFLLWSIVLYSYYGFPSIGGNYVMNIFWGCVIYQVTYKVVNKDNLGTFFKCLLWLVAINIFYMAMQFQAWDLIFLDTTKNYAQSPVGFFGLKAFMGIFLAMMVPIVAMYNTKLSFLLFLPMYYSECSVAITGAISAILFHLWFQSKKAFIVCGIFLSVFGSFYVLQDTKANMFSDRFSLWKISLRDAFKHPIMGWGLDSFRNIGEFKPFIYFKNNRSNESFPVNYKTLQVYNETGKFPPSSFLKENDTINPWDHPHNEYISIFYEFGAVGFLIFCAFLSDIRKRFFETPALIAIGGVFIVILICCTGQFPFHVARIGYLCPIFLAIYFKITDDFKKQIEGVPVYGA